MKGEVGSYEGSYFENADDKNYGGESQDKEVDKKTSIQQTLISPQKNTRKRVGKICQLSFLYLNKNCEKLVKVHTEVTNCGIV